MSDTDDDSSDNDGGGRGKELPGWQEKFFNKFNESNTRLSQSQLRKAAVTKQAISDKLPKKIKQIQFVLDIIKIISILTSFTGVSLVIFFITANVELFLIPILFPWWKQQTWRRSLVILLDFLVGLLLLMAVGLVVWIHEEPNEACKILGGGVGWVVGNLGLCGVAGELVKSILIK